ncbi:hypothetical protein BOVATA_038430 [Babesia ovata]|uniref:Uncharacterized protein n=1 Tax=Babesia ovata TaxID=189622 RepID=A0A2H6KH82_9APIC|nr:uncharacterized protein BOVATA_038430 [Babesia ovata]GBE62350.1 hypothetical protein BOVATA_038430 [Babesia ovata]
MSKTKRGRKDAGRGPHPGDASNNLFDTVRRSAPAVSVRTPKSRRTKFRSKSAAESAIPQTSYRKAQKLDLFNLNKPLNLTHRNEPIENHYEGDVSDSSEDDFRYTGDMGGLPKALEEHKLRKALERQEKDAQRDLLSQLDSEYRDLDLEKFVKPRRGMPQMPVIQEKVVTQTKSDQFDANLRQLMLAPQQSKDGGDLLSQLFAAKDIDAMCELSKEFVRLGNVSHKTAKKCVIFVARALSELLASPSGHLKFCECFDTLVEFVHYLSQLNPREYHAYFSTFLKGVYVSFEKGVELSLEALVVLYFVIKLAKVGSAMYRGGLLVLEKVADECNVEDDPHERVRLLVAMSYSTALDSGLYMPFFFSLTMKVCVAWSSSRPHLVEPLLDMVTVVLKLLHGKDCHVYPICVHVISPNIAELKIQSPKIESLKVLVKEYTDVELLPYVLDTYKRPKIELEVPKYGTVSDTDANRDSGVKRDKALYRSLKKDFVQTHNAAAKLRSLELRKRRTQSREKYRKVVRDAMIEHEELRKEMLRLYRRFSGVVNLHRFNEAALNQLQALHDTLETVDDICSISFDGTVLTAEIDPKQYIVLNKHEASQQIWYSSFNGVDYFAIEGGKWLSRRTGRQLEAVLKNDVQQATGKAVDFSNAED